MKKLFIFVVIIIVWLLLPFSVSKSQNLQRHEAISAYIYNFAKNVQWQNEESFKEFHFLVLGDDENIIKELNALSVNKKLRNKLIKIISSNTLGSLNSVQLIFVTKGQTNNLAEIFDKIEGKNILLITDGCTDKRLIMINFYDSEKGKLLFEINKANIINQHLTIMQDMILLGGTEVDVAALYKEGQNSLRSLQKHSDDLENNIKKLNKITNDKNQELKIQKDSLERQNIKIQEQEKLFNKMSFDLNERNKELAAQIQKIKEQQDIFDKQAIEIKNQKEALVKGNELLLIQKENIQSQKDEISNKLSFLKVKIKNFIGRNNLFIYL